MENKKEIYNEEIETLYQKFKSSEKGLTSEEAKKRLEENGENKLLERKKKSNLILFLGQFNDFMIILLIFASIFSAGISYVKGESFVDSFIIIIIVIINATLSFLQEKKADAAIEELNKMFITKNYVYRDEKKQSIDVREIVVGDVVELVAGDYVSADGRVISSESLKINESTLTGESKAIKKTSDTLKGKKELYERENMVFAGCNVTNGHAFVLVTSTAMDTELGKIANSLMDKKSDLTPLQKKINEVSKILTYIVVAIIIIMMIIGLLKKNDFFDVLMLSISLAVAAIPEGLSSIITIILSIGMTEMAKKNVIIRKMASVETLGSADIICSDKTGTITKNDMTVKKIYVNNKLYTDEDEINSSMLFLNSYLNSDVVKENNKYMGDETEIAIYKYLEKVGFSPKEKLVKVKEYPFDSDRKMMSVTYKLDDELISFTKGSLDSVLKRSTKYLLNDEILPIDEKFRKKVLDVEKKLSLQSLRCLAYAYTKTSDYEKNLIFTGLIGMMDPPKENAKEAIYKCLNSGIKPVMITGDSLNTAFAIAKDVGICSSLDEAIEGKYIEKMSDDELIKAVLKYRVYSRISPNSKLRIIEALQSYGNVVAMTGDGVNDAPAIQKADIGIGMGKGGTEVVKKVADCILVDDSFATIVDGVEEGRRITSNIKKVILYLLAGNIVEVLLVFISLLLNMEMFTTLQLLWINLVTDSIPAIMLAFENNDKDLMKNSLSNKNQSFFTPFLTAKITISAIFKSTIMLILFIYYANVKDSAIAGSLMFIYLIANELLFAFSCRNLKHSVINKNIFKNKRLNIGVAFIAIIQIIVLTTGLSKFFIVSDIGLVNVLFILIICFITFIFGELVKPLYSKFFKDYVEA